MEGQYNGEAPVSFIRLVVRHSPSRWRVEWSANSRDEDFVTQLGRAHWSGDLLDALVEDVVAAELGIVRRSRHTRLASDIGVRHAPANRRMEGAQSSHGG